MLRVSHCALCNKPFSYVEVNGKREYDLWSRIEEPDIIYCSEQCCYLTLTAYVRFLKEEGVLMH